MATFLTDLWSSIFTPGPTPTLLVATNTAFAALQLVLAGLLYATYSIHFAILSVLCGGLWYSINWFAAEVKLADAQAKAKKDEDEAKAGKRRDWMQNGEVMDSADDEDEDTEVEDAGNKSVAGLKRSEGETGSGVLVGSSTGVDTGGEQASAGSAVSQSRLRVQESDRSGEISSSTDSEWERVSQDGDR